MRYSDRMQKPDAQYPVLIWALTIRGEMMAVHCSSRAEALEIGRANVASGVWRTWDAFEAAGNAAVEEARKIASSSSDDDSGHESESEKSPRPRILADWTPPEPPAKSAAPAPARAPGKVRITEGRHEVKRTTQEKEKEKEKPMVARRRRIIPE